MKNKKYNIFGIGSALLDIEVLVSDNFLNINKIKKGVMTLVTEESQFEMLEALSSHNFEVIRKSGGSVCNSLVAASSFGSKTFFNGKIANDSDGDYFCRDLNLSGVGYERLVNQNGITGKCIVLVSEDAERSMCTFLGINESLSEGDINKIALANSDWMYIEGYMLTNEKRNFAIVKAIEEAKLNDVKIAFSLSDSFLVQEFRPQIKKVLDYDIDLLFCNSSEAMAMSDAQDVYQAAENMKKYCKQFAITDGANGAIVYDGSKLIRSVGHKTKPIDTTGAGDMFAGSFIHAINHGYNFREAAYIANYCASLIVASMGPRLTTTDLMLIKEKFKFS